MLSPHPLAAGVLVAALSASALHAQTRSHYRDYQLGASLPTVAALVGAPASVAKTLHQRPALLQELEWRPSAFVGGSVTTRDEAVQVIVFSFYNDQLFRLVVDYNRQRTTGMTDADMIQAVSAMYGPVGRLAKTPSASISLVEQESGTAIAAWGDLDYGARLYRSSYADGFRLILTSRRLEPMARTADLEAARLDAIDVPRQELARQKKDAADAVAAQEKARTANKAAFKP